MSKHKKKGKNKRVWQTLGFILLIFSSIILLFVMLIIIDVFHAEIDGLIFRFFGVNNHFGGEVWFAVIATCFAAIPGMICGFIALVQTKRIHELEDRYHRPSLRLREAMMEVYWIRKSMYENCVLGDARKRHFADRMLEDEKFKGSFLRLTLEMESKNDVEVETMEIKEITFDMANVKYRLVPGTLKEDIFLKRNCDFSRKFEDEKYLYCIDCVMYPYEFHADKGIGEEKFWNAIEKFTNYQGNLDDEYETIEMVIETDVYYEYAVNGCEKVIGKILWNCHQGTGRCGVRAESRSNNGFFAYYE